MKRLLYDPFTDAIPLLDDAFDEERIAENEHATLFSDEEWEQLH